MASQRIARVQKLLRSEISSILQRKTKDPRVTMITITEVDASPDLKNARVYFSTLGDHEAESAALAGLRSAAGFIRSELMKVLHLRPMPALEFTLDRSLARGTRTLDILDRIRHEQDQRGPNDGPGE
jgi:ribosome-binding factor A